MHRRARTGPQTGFSRRRKRSSQSAMEYLMTYGWAILIIAVVLGILFQLGVFNGATFAPKAKPGQCQVQVLGSGSSITHQLAGLCQPELPQYVATFSAASSVTANVPGSYPNTVAEWVYQSDSQAEYDIFSSTPYTYTYFLPTETIALNVGGADSYQAGALELMNTCGCALQNSFYQANGVTLSNNAWHFIALTYDPLGNPEFLVDGILYPTTKFTSMGPGLPAGISTGYMDTAFGGVNGKLANVQIYNITLSQAEATAIYDEGIGGAPVRPQNVTGWWPLNSNLNDYSGNSNNGQPAGPIGYTGSWAGGYHGPQ